MFSVRTSNPVFALGSIAVVFATLGLAPAAHAEETHTIDVPARARLAVGKPSKVSITVRGKNGWHVNEEAPISLKLTAPAGVTVGKDKLARPDLAESTPDRVRFDVEVTCAAAGEAKIEAEARFVMCQESACKPVKETVTLALEAGAAPVPPKRK